MRRSTLTQQSLVIIYFSVGSEVGQKSEPVSVLKLLSDVNVIYGLLLISYTAAMWSCIDPILEPELRRKVNHFPQSFIFGRWSQESTIMTLWHDDGWKFSPVLWYDTLFLVVWIKSGVECTIISSFICHLYHICSCRWQMPRQDCEYYYPGLTQQLNNMLHFFHQITEIL